MVSDSRQGVKVVHGAESATYAGLIDQTVGWAAWQLRHPLNIPIKYTARLNGRDAGPGDILSPSDVLEFFGTELGHKGRDELLMPQEFMEFTGLEPTEYEYLRAQGMPVLESPDGPQLVMGAVGKWLRDQRGVFTAAARNAFARARLRVNEREGVAWLDGQSHPITLEQAILLKALVRNPGQWVSSREIQEERPDLPLPRFDRVCKRLPGPIRQLIPESRII
jgi:hypothetical protein